MDLTVTADGGSALVCDLTATAAVFAEELCGIPSICTVSSFDVMEAFGFRVDVLQRNIPLDVGLTFAPPISDLKSLIQSNLSARSLVCLSIPLRTVLRSLSFLTAGVCHRCVGFVREYSGINTSCRRFSSRYSSASSGFR